jgi:hypothetical protein
MAAELPPLRRIVLLIASVLAVTIALLMILTAFGVV